MYDSEYQIAIEAARQAGAIILKHYKTDYEIREKSRDNPVTVADHESNARIKDVLLSEFPDDGWLSEESKDDLSRINLARVWIVDPLDGTKEFIAKINEFAVSIALVEGGRPVVGVIYNPVTDELFSARKGEGAWLNGETIEVSTQDQLSEADILASRSELKRNEWDAHKKTFHVVRSGGMAHKMSLVACGFADGSFSLQPKNEWDFAAGDLIIHEAGGMVTGLGGELFAYNKENPRSPGLIYGNPHLFPQLLQIVKAAL